MNETGAGEPTPQASSTETTVELVERVRAGEARAREALCARFLPRLRRWAAGRLPTWARDLSETDDLVQETLLRVLRRLDQLDESREIALNAYLRTAVDNRIRDEMRRNGRRRRVAQSLNRIETDSQSAVERVIGKERLQLFERALSRLPESYRDAIVARFEFGLSYQELAEETGRPTADAARMFVKRGVRRLAEEIARAGA